MFVHVSRRHHGDFHVIVFHLFGTFLLNLGRECPMVSMMFRRLSTVRECLHDALMRAFKAARRRTSGI
jgi:hypothetical protein